MGSYSRRAEEAADRRLKREQRKGVSTVMTSTRRVEIADDHEEAPILPAEAWPKVEILPTAPRMRPFVRFEGKEYEIRGRVHDSQFNDARQHNEVWFERIEQVVTPGSGAYRDRYFIRAIEYPAGEYDRRRKFAEAAEEKKARTQTEPAPRFVDIAEFHDILAARPGTPIPLGHDEDLEDAASSEQVAAALARPFYSKLPAQYVTRGSEPIRGIEAIHAWFTEHAEFVVERGRVLALFRVASAKIAAVEAEFRAGLHGIELGTPKPCDLDHETPVSAYTKVIGDVWVCREHMDGAL